VIYGELMIKYDYPWNMMVMMMVMVMMMFDDFCQVMIIDMRKQDRQRT
jgi:hypothetical protein